MPIDRFNTRSFHRRLYSGAGYLESVTLLKRGNDQSQGTVTSYAIYQCRRSRIQHTGNPIQNDEAIGDRTVWHVPKTELDRIGVAYLNALDRIVDKKGRYWQPEEPQVLDIALFENQLHIQCVRVNP